jgi:hypothetical protein
MSAAARAALICTAAALVQAIVGANVGFSLVKSIESSVKEALSEVDGFDIMVLTSSLIAV